MEQCILLPLQSRLSIGAMLSGTTNFKGKKIDLNHTIGSLFWFWQVAGNCRDTLWFLGPCKNKTWPISQTSFVCMHKSWTITSYSCKNGGTCRYICASTYCPCQTSPAGCPPCLGLWLWLWLWLRNSSQRHQPLTLLDDGHNSYFVH